jgi:hypothetical protein
MSNDKLTSLSPRACAHTQSHEMFARASRRLMNCRSFAFAAEVAPPPVTKVDVNGPANVTCARARDHDDSQVSKLTVERKKTPGALTSEKDLLFGRTFSDHMLTIE